MIQIFEGKVGSGKTYSAVVAIMLALADGRTIATNIELNVPALVALIKKRYGVVVQDEMQIVSLVGLDVGEFHKITPAGEPGASVEVFLDESHLEFNARDWNKTSRELLAFLTQSRKQHTNVTFIAHSATTIDKQFRVQNQFYWRFRDTTQFRIPGLGISYQTCVRMLSLGILDGNSILACQYDYDGKTMLSKKFVGKDPEIFKCYNTYALLSSFERSGARGRVALERSKEKGQVAVRLILVLVLIIGGYLYFQWKLGNKEKPAATVAPGQAPAAAPVPDFQISKGGQNIGEKLLPQFRTGSLPGMREEDREAAKAAYDVFSERFVSYFGGAGGRQLKTSAGTYRHGNMSGKGFVLAVEDRQAKILQPDGRFAWIVAEDESAPAIEPPAEPKKEAPQAIVGADSAEPGAKAAGEAPKPAGEAVANVVPSTPPKSKAMQAREARRY